MKSLGTKSEDFFSRGLAIGSMDITRGIWFFRFRNEDYEVPSVEGWAYMKFVNRFPVSPIEWIRKVGKQV